MSRHDAQRKFLFDLLDARIAEKAKAAAQAGEADMRIANRCAQVVLTEVRLMMGVMAQEEARVDAEEKAVWEARDKGGAP